VDERIRERGPRDHVRFLAFERLDLDGVVRGAPASTRELVPGGVPPQSPGEDAEPEGRSRLPRPLQGKQRRPDEQLEADERGDRISRQPEHERTSADPEPQRLTRLDRDAPEHLADPQLRAHAANEVVRPDRDSTRAENEVALERRRECPSVSVRIVLHGLHRHDDGPGRLELGGQHHAVRLVDLTVLERLPRTPQLTSGREHRGARLQRTGDLRHAGCGESAELRGSDDPPCLDDDIPSMRVASSRSHVRPGNDRLLDLDAGVSFDNKLDRHDGIRAVGDDSPGCDRRRFALLEGAPGRAPGRDLLIGDSELPRGVGCTKGEAVHRRAGKRRQVDTGAGGFRQHTPGNLFERDRLALQRTGALEDEVLRRFQREKLRHLEYATRPVISVVVPVHDEELTVTPLYEELAAALTPLGQSWEAVFVDDGSADGSFAALTRLHSGYENVRVVRLRRNFGKAAALAAGFAQARGDVVVTIDADLQDDPGEIPRLLAKLEEGFDLVSGWKTRRRDPVLRRVLSKLFNVVTSRISGLRLHDLNCGLKAYRADVLEGLRIYGELHRFLPVLAHYQGFRVAELPVNHRPRVHGRSRYGPERYVRGFLDLLTVTFIGRYRHRPLHLFGGLGLLLGSVGFGVLTYLTILKATGEAIGHRPLLLAGVLLVVVGLQLFSLGLLSEMVTSQHEERASLRDLETQHVEEILS